MSELVFRNSTRTLRAERLTHIRLQEIPIGGKFLLAGATGFYAYKRIPYKKPTTKFKIFYDDFGGETLLQGENKQ